MDSKKNKNWEVMIEMARHLAITNPSDNNFNLYIHSAISMGAPPSAIKEILDFTSSIFTKSRAVCEIYFIEPTLLPDSSYYT